MLLWRSFSLVSRLTGRKRKVMLRPREKLVERMIDFVSKLRKAEEMVLAL